MNKLPYRFLTIFLACLSCKSTDNKAVSKPEARIQEKSLSQLSVYTAPTLPLNLDISVPVANAMQNVRAAMKESTLQSPAWVGGLPAEISFREILDPKRKRPGSFSFGSVGRGELKNGVQLEHVGEYHEIMEQHRKNKTNYGTKELTDLIRHSAFVVSEKHKGAKLRIGNLSQKGGGDIRWSRSHNSGRDADIAFYVLNAKGESENAKAITKALGDGSVPRFPGYTFDVERNWTFVEALINHKVGLQWIFISNELKDKLLRYADEKGVDEEVLRRAANVLHQPTDALPHDDHFHIRISCPIKDRIDGCLPAGPSWEWLPDSRPYQLSRAIELGKAIREGTAKEQAAAIDFMTNTKQLFRADLALSLVSSAKTDALKLKLIRLAAKPYTWSDYSLQKIREIIPQGQKDPFLSSAYVILRRSLAPESLAFSISRMKDTTIDIRERKLAIQSTRHAEDGEVIGELITMLEKGPDELKSAIHLELQFMTNHLGGKENWPKKAEQQTEVLATWKALETTFGDSHQQWREAGFVSAGLRNTSEPDVLIPFLENSTLFQAYNANRRLREVTGRWSALEFSNQEALHKKWKKWWDRNSPKDDPIAYLNARDFFLMAIES